MHGPAPELLFCNHISSGGKDVPVEPIKVVLRYTDGRVVKGLSNDFYPDRDRFHLLGGGSPAGRETEIPLTDLKAVFIVRELSGDPSYREQKSFSRETKTRGQKVEVTFMDGEVLVGSTLGPGVGLKRKGFFFFPADPKSNILRAFLFSSAIRRVRPLPEAEIPPAISRENPGFRRIPSSTPSPRPLPCSAIPSRRSELGLSIPQNTVCRPSK